MCIILNDQSPDVLVYEQLSRGSISTILVGAKKYEKQHKQDEMRMARAVGSVTNLEQFSNA